LNLIEEYIHQQEWRNWSQYLKEIPISKKDRIVDLGCSVGSVSNLLSKQVALVTGIDLNSDFINYCLSSAQSNQNFICNEFTKINYALLLPLNGIWSSFALSYLKEPRAFLKSLFEILQPEGWISLVDVSLFVSGNMLPECKHYDQVRNFEIESRATGIYDFDFGSKMEGILKEVGFEITHVDNNVSDPELNFNGAANPKILANWKARLERMHGLRRKYPHFYSEIVQEITTSLTSTKHSKNNNVRFVVAKKI
jgi:SAM-dependent methyltransferase